MSEYHQNLSQSLSDTNSLLDFNRLEQAVVI